METPLDRDIITFLDMHFATFGQKACAEQLGISESRVRGIAERRGLKRDPASRRAQRSEALSRYHRDNPKTSGFSVDLAQFLNIQTKEVAYFLGLFWADGTLYRKGHNNSLRLEMVAEDGESLKPSLMKLGKWSSGQRQRHRNGKKFGRLQMSFSCNNRPLAEWLCSMDYDTKSVAAPTKILTAIPSHLKHYFWRGYLDGDGCIFVPKNNLSKWATQVAFWGAIDQDWSALTSLLKELGVNHILVSYERAKPNGVVHRSSVINITRKWELLKLLTYLYQGEPIGLTRKRAKFDQVKEHFVRLSPKSGSHYRGVFKPKSTPRWAARIKKDKQATHLGMFDTQEEAALAYNAKALELFGEDAQINDIEFMKSVNGDLGTLSASPA